MPELTPKIPSEAIEPTAALLIGRMYARCEEIAAANGPDQEQIFIEACKKLWGVATNLNRLSILVGDALHFSIACGNTLRMVAAYTEEKTGRCPIKEEWDWTGEPKKKEVAHA